VCATPASRRDFGRRWDPVTTERSVRITARYPPRPGAPSDVPLHSEGQAPSRDVAVTELRPDEGRSHEEEGRSDEGRSEQGVASVAAAAFGLRRNEACWFACGLRVVGGCGVCVAVAVAVAVGGRGWRVLPPMAVAGRTGPG
jgi:hypothetical protein